MLDCYNQAVSDLAVTITTRVDAANMIYIAEEMNMDTIEKEPIIVASGGRGEGNVQSFEPRTDGLTNTLTSVQKDNYVKENIQCECVGMLQGGKWDKMHESSRRVYSENGLAPTQHCCGGGNLESKVQTNSKIRKLTPRECFRLMGCDEPTIDTLTSCGISNSQLYKLAGNSIVVDVLTAIFDKMLVHTDVEIGQQMALF